MPHLLVEYHHRQECARRRVRQMMLQSLDLQAESGMAFQLLLSLWVAIPQGWTYSGSGFKVYAPTFSGENRAREGIESKIEGRMIMMVKRIFCLLLLAGTIFATAGASHAQVAVGISVSFGPPALPIYEQPILPAEGYIWTPGYWAWSGDDYFWVPGTWVLAPEPGFLWTPGYWGWGGEAFVFYPGYWGPHVGFYGGINYGYGYFGRGFEGGRWDNGRFFYNRSVNNINVTNIHNVYNTTVINNNNLNRVSFNGGQGGIQAQATPQERAAQNERHIAPVQAQVQHEQAARSNPQQFASANHGKPAVAATPTPGALNDRGAVQAKQAGAPYNSPANRGAGNGAGNGMGNGGARNAPPVHVKDTTPIERPSLPSTGNSSKDQKYQQQQQKLAQKQDQERQQLQQKQEADHQRLAQQKANDAKQQQLEQKHQQQTQQLQQKHTQQQQQLQQKVQREAPPSNSGKPHP
jgi:hypothetical protein